MENSRNCCNRKKDCYSADEYEFYIHHLTHTLDKLRDMLDAESHTRHREDKHILRHIDEIMKALEHLDNVKLKRIEEQIYLLWNDLPSIIEDNATKEYVQNLLKEYYTKEELDDRFKGFEPATEDMIHTVANEVFGE